MQGGYGGRRGSLECKEGMEAGGVVYNARRVWRPEG